MVGFLALLYNSLTLHIRQLHSISIFKAQIKTQLFRLAFSDLIV